MPSSLTASLLVLMAGMPFNYTNQLSTPRSGVEYVIGILGYTNDCRFALYPDQVAAIVRDSKGAIPLSLKSLTNGVVVDDAIRKSVYRFVTIEGHMTHPSSAVSEFRVDGIGSASSRYVSNIRDGGRACKRFHSQPVDVTGAMDISGHGYGGRTLVFGYLGKEQDYHVAPTDRSENYTSYYNLYFSREAYEERVAGLSIAVDIDAPPPPLCNGKLVVLDGVLGRRGVNDRSVTYLRGSKVAATTCGESD